MLIRVDSAQHIRFSSDRYHPFNVLEVLLCHPLFDFLFDQIPDFSSEIRKAEPASYLCRLCFVSSHYG